MPAPLINALPTAPQRTDAPAVFVSLADAFVEALADFVTETNALGTYLETLDAGTLSALLNAISGAGSAANKISYYTGSNAVALADFTTLARTLLACTTAAAMRSAIGAGTGTGDLVASNNLSDLASAATARTNLGLLSRIACFFTTTPTVSEVLAIYIAADAFTLAANLSGSQVSVGTNPSATFAIDVQKNGSTIATISIATNGAVTLTTVSGTSKAIAAGDTIKFVAPSPVDTTCANVAVTLKGTL